MAFLEHEGDGNVLQHMAENVEAKRWSKTSITRCKIQEQLKVAACQAN